MKYSPTTTTTTAYLGITLLLAPSALGDGDGDNCITLTGDDTYTWKADGDFTGSGSIDNNTHCFPGGSGGISIGAPGAEKGAPGNTRLECYFPTDGETDTDFYNCNLSLIDGFSAAVTCAVAGGGWPNSNDATAPLGCGYDLLAECPAENYDDGCKCCKNHQGATVGSVGEVDPVFQQCKDTEENPNSAEVFHSMKGSYKISKGDFPLECTVGAGERPKVKRAVDAHHGGGAHSRAHRGHGQRGLGLGRSKVHAREVKARGLLDALS